MLPSRPNHPSDTGYRPDIDGLRAIAVSVVIIFHFFPLSLSGGFVGVDIFFVISGYLISGLILREEAEGRFTLGNFYARRIKRIFPALSLILLFCLLIGWVMMTESEYKQLGKHTAGGAGFVDNLVSWNEAGYFDNAADTKPLLHLWSLGIEEQFYLFWPPIMLYFIRKTNQLKWAFILLTGISFLSGVVLLSFNVNAAFYSPMTRFWELLLGGGLAYGLIQNPDMDHGVRRLAGWVGGIFILLAVVIISKDNLFPGGWALLPSVGAALVILAGGAANGWLNRQLLATPPLVWLGLISYPLYLWHWPLLVFARILEGDTPSETTRVVLILASIVLAWITWRWLERPIRFGPSSSLTVLLLCGAMVLMLVAGVVVKKLNGVEFRHKGLLNGEMSTMVVGADRGKHKPCGIISDEEASLFKYCWKDGRQEPRYAVVGDSKGEALFHGLMRESKPDHRWLLIGSFNPLDIQNNSNNAKKAILAYDTIEKDQRIQVVALVNSLRGIFPIDKRTGFVDKNKLSSGLDNARTAFSSTIQQLQRAGKRVVFVLDHPTFPDPRSCIAGGLTGYPLMDRFFYRRENPLCTLRYTDHLAGTQPYREFTQQLKEANPGLIVYDPTPLLCDAEKNDCPMIRNRTFLYSYGDHISDYTNSMVAKELLSLIEIRWAGISGTQY